MTASRISIAVHRLTRLFLAEPARRMTLDQIQVLTELDEGEVRIVVEALKDAHFLVETSDGFVGCRSVPAA